MHKTGLILAGHNGLAGAFRSALEFFDSAHLENLVSVDLNEKESVNQFTDRLKKAIAGLDQCHNILIMVDLPGSIPYKAACEACNPDCYVLAGMNLGMLIEINQMRFYEPSVQTLIDQALLVGKEQILCAQHQ